MPWRSFTASMDWVAATMLAMVGVVGVLPCSISWRVRRAHERRAFSIFQSFSLIVHS